ncbi:AEC family transporter [Jiella pacifica]|uniref:Transporter n=1 Tax=Jiella pacifica TaxID=2696469 RepID=A0A6N9T3K7_9HYPH|nr:AEC family transporter [Jiella pacifica]NDW05954.1 hypothetical protein [Jiella pacifica]
MLLSLADRLFPVFLLIAIGYVLARKNILTRESLGGLTKLTYWVLIPATLFSTVTSIHVGETLNLRIWAVYFGAVLTTALAIYAVLLTMHDMARRERIVIAFGAVYSNIGIVGIPVVGILYGDEGLVTLTAIISIHALALITPMVVLMEGSRARGTAGGSVLSTTLRSQFRNPIIVAIVVSLTISAAGFDLPGWLSAPAEMLKAAMPAVALMVIGAGLHGQEIRSSAASSVVGVIGKMAVLPLTVFLFAWLAGLPQTVVAPLVICAALPPGINSVMMAAAYDTAVNRIATLVLAATLASLVTIPVLALLLAA